MLQLLAITDPGCPSSTRYRVTQFAACFLSRGAQMQIVPCPRKPDGIVRLLAAVQSADIVVIQRFLPRTALIKELRRHARRLVFDFDDAVIYEESTQRRPRVKVRRWLRFRQMMLHCDAITAGNAYLAGIAAKHAGSGRVFTVPTVVDVERYDREPAPARSGVILGWIGAQSTLPYLEKIRRPLEKISLTHPGLTLRVVADKLPDLGKFPTSLTEWRESTEVRDLKSLNVGLAPLPDDAWTRGKCGLRLLQYLAAGIPAVASPVGTQAEIIRQGGALSATSDGEWPTAIQKLLSDSSTASLIARGKEIVREQYSLALWSPRLFGIWCG